jgi:flagellar hook-basal body complex protein FliE
MNDPLGLIQAGGVRGVTPPTHGQQAGKADPDAPQFVDLLKQNLEEVNRLQADANQAMEDLTTGRRDDVATVIGATQKADLAFQMLLQVRNKVMDAYEELKQMRV